ncbi:Dihydropteroate synthase [Nitrosospira multiformis ATCC 25196]|uniref:Dihydropteroate synthase n=2 Tax=Nitrosospira multiformis (strain ATCC 25196 / NCIMB 11849 / C 71) TaxID=323848 RepID=Q2YBS9_NITMU|nr:Dihydropteroate synthase [Nitrosospira multiformis ATCC 25196]
MSPSSIPPVEIFRLSHRPLVMGVVNITPDSFSDGGLFASTDHALNHAFHLMEEGADLLDVGGESTRPGSTPVFVEEELRRILPVVEELANQNVRVSVDTSKPEVMRAAIAAGAVMINDVRALQMPGALEAVAEGGVMACLMHMQGEPANMQVNPQYDDVVQDVKVFLKRRVEAAQAAGIPRERLVVDPGFGFGKNQVHNIELLRHLDQFIDLGVPVLVGLSRKSMLGKITGSDINNRIHASIAAALIAAMKGAAILRVHDVRATRDALAVYNAVYDRGSARENASSLTSRWKPSVEFNSFR